MRWIALFGLVILLTAGYLLVRQAPVPTPVVDLPNTPLVVFDYDGRHAQVTQETLMQGDGVIFLSMDEDGRAWFFTSLNDFRHFDPTRDGYIGIGSPGFSKLYVGRYLSDPNLVEYQKILHSGVAGIVLNYKGRTIGSAHVVLTDSSQRTITTVLINDRFLTEAKPVSADKDSSGQELEF